MSSDDEDDYMSEKFLTKCVRPGLIKNRIKEREINILEKKRKYIESQKQESTKKRHSNNLQESLNRPLTGNNKGFELLSKMGYIHGEPLGKNNQGIIEPIAISIKPDRSGFGREAAVSGLIKKKQDIINKRNYHKKNTLKQTTEEFRKRICLKAEERLLEIALRKCQSACEKLDEKANIINPVLDFFWQTKKDEEIIVQNEPTVKDNAEIDAVVDQYDCMEKLEMITYYMRTTYYYCHWCGTQYQNSEDLNQNCPGLNKNDH